MKAEWTNRDSLSIESTSQNSKAILVIDMPNNCAECPIRLSGEPNEWCWYLRHGLDDIKAKPSWCPLKHPLKSVDNDFYIYDRRYLFDNLDREIKLLMSTKRFEEYMKAKGETE